MDLVYHRFRGYDNVNDRVQKASLVIDLIRRSTTLPRETLVDMARSIPLGFARAAVLKEIEAVKTTSTSSTRSRCSLATSRGTAADDEYDSDDGDSWTSSSSGWTTTSTDDDATVATADVFTGDAGFVAEARQEDDDDDNETEDSRSTSSGSNATFSSDASGTLVSDAPSTAESLVRSLMARIEMLESIVYTQKN